MKRKNYRHGDVVIVPTKIADVSDCTERKEPVLAYGEVTGHSHRFVDGVVKVFEYNKKTYLRVISEYALLRHEEHKEIKLPQGDYEFWIQKEWQEDGWAKVLD